MRTPRRLSVVALAVALAVACTPSGRGPGRSPSPMSSRPATSASPPSNPSSSAPVPTPPSASQEPRPARTFGFAVIGDFGSKDRHERAVADEIREWATAHPLDGLVTTGDNVYEDGAPEDFDEAWSEPYGWVDERGIPLLAALGNHDVHIDGGEAEMDLLRMPGRWYARRIGPVRFLVLDSNDVGDSEQMRWLRARLAEDRARWTVVVFHFPVFSCGFHPSTPGVDALWMPMFAQAGVDLVLNGHDHNYQRFPAVHGVTSIVDGSGGNDLYPAARVLCPNGTPAPEFVDDEHHLFLYLDVTRERLAGRAVTSGGEVVDRFELRSGPGR